MRARLVGLALAAAVSGACGGGARLQAKATAIGELVELARENGAIKCAPVELAMAESHREFALEDLSQGNYYRAKDELLIAERNAREAVRRSPRAKCAPGPQVAEAPGDRDGDGIPDDVDECPDDPEDFDGFEDEDGCPDPDNDGDGIPDDVDECPNDPEDFDGFEDEDGCPDPDNDGDGVPDEVDKCPNEPGPPENDGCPKEEPPPKTYDLVVVTEEKIELKQTIFFDFNKSTIKRVSYPLLNQVAEALTDNPTITVRIEGHTDSRGRAAYNLRLSQARADAVKKYLVQRGIAVNRMVSNGYGQEVPIADNRTDEGRAENRRVEFVITGR